MSTAWVALGANLGDPSTTFRRALRALGALPHTRLEACSSFHRTTPVGPPQPDFLNAVARLGTHLGPHDLLAALQALEAAAGRERGLRWGPRTLDLDLLWMNDGLGRRKTVRDDALELPHPRMGGRPFVLAPLAEIDPELARLAASL